MVCAYAIAKGACAGALAGTCAARLGMRLRDRVRLRDPLARVIHAIASACAGDGRPRPAHGAAGPADATFSGRRSLRDPSSLLALWLGVKCALAWVWVEFLV